MKSKTWQITPDKFLTHNQISKLLKFVEDRKDLAKVRNNNLQAIRDYYLIRTLLETGVRCFEFCNLKNKDFSSNRLFISQGKGSKSRTIILTKSCTKLIKEWIKEKSKLGFSTESEATLFPTKRGGKYSTRGVQKRIRFCFDGSGLPSHLCTHSLRHTYCCLLMESRKVGLPTIRNNMGHSSIQTTNIYSHATENLDDVEIFGNSDFFNKSELKSPS